METVDTRHIAWNNLIQGDSTAGGDKGGISRLARQCKVSHEIHMLDRMVYTSSKVSMKILRYPWNVNWCIGIEKRVNVRGWAYSPAIALGRLGRRSGPPLHAYS